jgi:hypothetical protein
MGDYWTNAVRHPEDVGVGHIRRTIRFDSSNVGTGLGIPIGALEAGAIPRHADVLIQTAFNGGTTNSFVLGTEDDDDGFITSAGAVAGTTGWKDGLKGALTGYPLDRNKVVYAKFTSTGTAPTAGVAIVTLTFVNKREIEGRAFPNNP